VSDNTGYTHTVSYPDNLPRDIPPNDLVAMTLSLLLPSCMTYGLQPSWSRCVATPLLHRSVTLHHLNVPLHHRNVSLHYRNVSLHHRNVDASKKAWLCASPHSPDGARSVSCHLSAVAGAGTQRGT
jgi:hypothetical protein